MAVIDSNTAGASWAMAMLPGYELSSAMTPHRIALPSSAKPKPADNWPANGPEYTSAAKASTGMMPTPYRSSPVARLVTSAWDPHSSIRQSGAGLWRTRLATLRVMWSVKEGL